MQGALEPVVALPIPKVVVFSQESCDCCFQRENESVGMVGHRKTLNGPRHRKTHKRPLTDGGNSSYVAL